MLEINILTTKGTVSIIKLTKGCTERQRHQLCLETLSTKYCFCLNTSFLVWLGKASRPKSLVDFFLPTALMFPSFSHWGTSAGGSWMWRALRQLLRQQWLCFEECRTSEKYYHLCGSLSYIRLSLDVYAVDWCLLGEKKRFREDFLFKYY